MVEIRRLRPTVRIALPVREVRDRVPQRIHVVRRRVDFPPPTPQPTPCILWQGSVSPKGYGRMKVQRKGQRVTIGVHRWIVETVEERVLDPDEFVMHLCDNPPCYRYDHLLVGTAAANNADMVNKGRLVHVANASPGERNGNAKLSEPQVAHIRQLYRRGLAAPTIADQYGISLSTVRRIVRGLSWRTHPVDLLAGRRPREDL